MIHAAMMIFAQASLSSLFGNMPPMIWLNQVQAHKEDKVKSLSLLAQPDTNMSFMVIGFL